MTQTTFTHPSASQWEEVLAFTDFPILQETREQLRLHLKNPQVSFDELIHIVDRDPALCWHLLQAATQQNPDCREQLSGALSCLSLLGMQELVLAVYLSRDWLKLASVRHVDFGVPCVDAKP